MEIDIAAIITAASTLIRFMIPLSRGARQDAAAILAVVRACPALFFPLPDVVNYL
jgi:hypothetical protein